MSNELTEAERAALDLIDMEENEWPWGTNVELARAIVAAVRPIIEAKALSGARALHGKPEFMDSFGVRVCPECSIPGYYEAWPCRTAIALGLAEGNDNP